MVEDAKEWVRVVSPANGKPSLTVTLQLDNVSVKWSVYTYGNMAKGLAEARAGAKKALADMTELLAAG